MSAITESLGSARKTKRVDWSPYLVGAGIGILSWVAFGVVKDPLGVTTAASRVASLFAEPFIGAEAVAKIPIGNPCRCLGTTACGS